jgi:DNA topoisomerase-2
MDAAAKSSSSKYRRLDPREHVLLRPGMYIGPVTQDVVSTYVVPSYDGPAGSAQIVKREVKYVPGLYKIFDEILVNAIDHSTSLQRKAKETGGAGSVNVVRAIKVTIDRSTSRISVENDGDGIDVAMHPEYHIYIPELIFGHMLTSSNYNDDEGVERVVGGQNGIGAKACNIFSKEFTIETVDARTHKRYVQTFRDNMTVREVPKITSAASKKPFTKITFVPDLARFGMTKLDNDIVSLFARRCYDACALTDKDVSVYIDGNKLDIKTFEKYMAAYFVEDARKVAYDLIDTPWGSWEVGATYSTSGTLEQVSFVNGVATLRGGKHVDYVANQIAARLVESVNKKHKDLDVKPATAKNHLFVFVKANVPNPTFDSQSKETLTTPAVKFSSKVNLSDKFFDKLLKTGIVDKIVEQSEMMRSKDLKKTDGKKRARVTGIVKLDDANWAGDKQKSKQCTLILTEGDSAKSTAIAGLSVVGSDKYGVFPLRGKLLNVKDVSTKKLLENEEIAHLKTILGLEAGKVYRDIDDLRYGRIMIMTDQDVDGSHIKGLLFNLFESLWPSLLRVPGFLTSLLTPIVKVRKGANVKSFYTLQDFEEWKASPEGSARGWDIKYYKGLGTSTNAEAKEYFKNMQMVTYGCDDPMCKDSLDLAFNKKRADDRKAWLRKYEKKAILEYKLDKNVRVSFDNFINKDFIHFSVYDNERSIPHVQDGLKVSQRKILFTCFKTNMTKEEKVFMLSASVAKVSAYHHGDASLYTTIVGLAQDYVGSNNINLLDPVGQFGTRRQGGKDAASAR